MLPVKIKVVNFGTIEREYRGVVKFYENRLSAICRFQVSKGSKMKDDYILLDPRGVEMDSLEFYQFIKKKASNGEEIVFAIGPPEGFESTDGHFSIALSKMTMRHELAYLFLLEQIYRSLLRMRGTAYEK